MLACPRATRFFSIDLSILCAIVFACVGCVPTSALADLIVLATRPAAVRGAPLLLPVRVRGALSASATAAILRADGSRIGPAKATMLWPVRVTAATSSRWATSGNAIIVQSERPADASDAYLAIELPAEIPPDASLEVELSGVRTRIEPQWHDPAAADLLARLTQRASALVPLGLPDALLSRPDPSMPLERFRFAIGCGLRSWEAPPEFPAGSPSDLAARAVTELWKAALARLASRSEGTAVEVAEMLIATCSDASAPAPIAAWICDPTEVSALLALALDRGRSVEATVEAVVSWLRVRSPVLAWVENETSDEIELALANPTSSEEIVRLQWLAGDDAPLAALLPPAEVTHVRVPRPLRAAIDGAPIPTDALDTLHLENRGKVRRFIATKDAVPAGIAGVSFGNFQAPLDLTAVTLGTEPTLAPRTIASLRPRLDGWEIYVEARDAEPVTAAAADGSIDATLPATDSCEVIGPNESVITVNALGQVDDPSGALEGSSGVEFRRYADRYRFGFTVPPSWLERREGQTIVRLGVRRRMHAAWFDAPFASVPWRVNARTVGVDILERN